MSEQRPDDELEDDGTVLDDDEPVEEPPSEDELASQYEGERETEPAGEAQIDDIEPAENPDNPDEPIIPEG